MDRGAWGTTVHGVAKSRTRLSDLAHTHKADLKSGQKPGGPCGRLQTGELGLTGIDTWI